MTKKHSLFSVRGIDGTWLLFAAAIIFVYFFGLDIPLLGPDEPRYSQVAREMFERGDWVTPTLGGHNWFEKPALLYWMQIAAYKVFGVSEFSARFGSALFGLGTILSLWILGRNVPADRSETTSDFAWWLMIIAASTLGLLVFARGASFDIVLTFPIAAAMVSFYIYDLRSRSKVGNTAIPLVLFYIFIGLSLLAKGLIGIVFPFAIVAFYLLLARRMPGKMLLVSLIWGSIVSAAIAALWYVPMYLQHGWEFIDEFFIQHHFQRYTSNKYFHPQPFYFFFWVLPLMTLPWMPFFFAAVWEAVAKRGQVAKTEAVTDTSLRLFAAAWIAVPLVFFSFSGSKLPGYILPAVPAAIIITAEFIYRWKLRGETSGTIVKLTAAGTLAAIVLALVLIVPSFADADSVKGLISEANERGYSTAPVASLHNVSHNAEFYAAGRIVRDQDGKQKKFLGPAEIVSLARQANGPVLVLVPLEYLEQATDGRFFDSEVIKDNGELAIVAVRAL